MHVVLIILIVVASLALELAIGFVCGRVTCELIHHKNPQLNEVMWFWFGFIFWWIAVLLALVVKKEN